MGVIRTVTLNSGFDDVFVADDVRWGEVDRLTAFRSDPSGKGINLARTLTRLGVPTHAYSLVGADDLDEFDRLLTDEGIPHTLEPVPGRTRHNLTLRSTAAGAPAAHLVGPGFHLREAGPVERLFSVVLTDLAPGDLLSLNGSLPAGLPEATWAGLVRHEDRVPLLFDLQGTALNLALEAHAPLAAVPNLAEARAALDEAELTPAEALDRFSDRGVELPIVTLGEAGALIGVDGQPHLVAIDVPDPQVMVGAGDSFAAGLAAVLVERPGDRLAAAVWATAVAGAHVAGADGAELLPTAKEFTQHVTVGPWRAD